MYGFPALFRKALQCRIGKVLRPSTTAVVAMNGSAVTVTMTWDDERWRDVGNDGQVVLVRGYDFAAHSRSVTL